VGSEVQGVRSGVQGVGSGVKDVGCGGLQDVSVAGRGGVARVEVRDAQVRHA
jgi:hypothetical protein